MTMGVVVHRIYAPLVSVWKTLGVQDAVHHGIAHVQVGRSHVEIRRHACARIDRDFMEQSGCETDSPCQAGQSAAVLTDLVDREIFHIRFSRLDELNGPLVELIEVVGSVIQAIPVVAHLTLSSMESTYSVSSFIGLVSQIDVPQELIGELKMR
jgi:hypothetical protein